MARAPGQHEGPAVDELVGSSLANLSIHGHNSQTTRKYHRILILGDSITHGGEGDYTWRYRLWQWFKQENLLAPTPPIDVQDCNLQQPSTSSPQRHDFDGVVHQLAAEARRDIGLQSLMQAVTTGSASQAELELFQERMDTIKARNMREKASKTDMSVSFVGPYTGVKGRDPPNPPHPAPLPGEEDPAHRPAERISWGYAHDVDAQFAGGCRHFATWGYQAFQCKDAIAEVVRDWQPDLILSLLGFNDVGWWVSDAAGTLDSIRAIIENTRAVKADVDFAFGNIVNRTYMEGRVDLLENTKHFNRELPVKAREWSKKGSRVVAVDVASHYDCGPQYRDWAPAAYDGLHPSALGEYQIAQAFSESLHRNFHMGSSILAIPDAVPKRNLQAPVDVEARSTLMGVRVIWADVYGAEFQLRHRTVGHDDWDVVQTHCPRADIDIPPDTQIELQIRSCHGFEHGPWSEICQHTCTYQPIPAPLHVRTRPTASGFAITWSPPPTLSRSAHISRYEVLWKDPDRGDVFPTLQGALDTSTSIKHIPAGHVIDPILIRGWSFQQHSWSSSPWAAGRAVRVGQHPAPQRPQDLRIEGGIGSDNSVTLAWDRSGDLSAAGYLVYVRDLTQEEGCVAETDGVVVRETRTGVGCVGFVWNYEFSVSAVNGCWESERSAGVIPPRE